MYDISGSGTYSVLEWAQVNDYLRQQSINTAHSSHVLIFCTGPTANDITQYLNNACNSLSFPDYVTLRMHQLSASQCTQKDSAILLSLFVCICSSLQHIPVCHVIHVERER